MTAEQLATFVAGLIASPLYQLIKVKLGWTGWKAWYTFFIFAIVLAAASMALTTELNMLELTEDPIATTASLIETFLAVFGIGQLVYKIFIAHPEE